MAMVSGSPRWSVSQKTAAWVLVLGSLFSGFVLSLLVLASTDAVFPAMFVAYLVAVAGSTIAGCTLLPQMSRRT
jgi:FtsH-binding integral membrane protein